MSPCIAALPLVRLPKTGFGGKHAAERSLMLSVAAPERIDYGSRQAKADNVNLKSFSVSICIIIVRISYGFNDLDCFTN